MTKVKTVKVNTDEVAFLANVRELASTRAGQEVLWRILELCNIYTDSFTGNSSTFYNEGRRSVGLQILAFLEDADPTIYPRLILQKLNQYPEPIK